MALIKILLSMEITFSVNKSINSHFSSLILNKKYRFSSKNNKVFINK